jgi:hypothetical protein
MSIDFSPAAQPFPRWWGPYSPARGTSSGFRFRGGRLGAFVEHEHGRAFCPIRRSHGIQNLERLVFENFRGGRVLFLPNGVIVKPLQGDEERGHRVCLGVFTGDVVLEMPDREYFSFEQPGELRPGELWPGPTSTGLECTISSNGELRCSWYHPAAYGRDSVSFSMTEANAILARGFRAARPGERGGRVRVTAKGHVITNRQVGGSWHCHYIGKIDCEKWPHLNEWIEAE